MSVVHFPILMYHQIMPEDHPHFKKHIAVSPDNLKKQISFLLDEGWKIITIEEYFNYPVGSRPKKVAALTFDDITKNFVEYAVPVLNELKVKANVFPIQNMTFNLPFHNLKPEGVPALTEEDIVQLDQQGFAIGSHGQSHRNFHKIPIEEAIKEMHESKEWLEGLLGKTIQTICFPIGGIDSDLALAAENLGYTIGISTFKGSLQILDSDKMALRRVNIKNDTLGNKLVSSVSAFYGFRRFLSRPFRAKYKLSERHPSVLGKM